MKLAGKLRSGKNYLIEIAVKKKKRKEEEVNPEQMLFGKIQLIIRFHQFFLS